MRLSQSSRGYTYFGALFVVFLISLALTGASLLWQVQQQREKEMQLLYIGQQYVEAIASYYHAAPGGLKTYPKSIQDLLRDPRYPTVVRHLRKPCTDPFTLSTEWGLIKTAQGHIAGIYSLSSARPYKQAGYGTADLERAFGDKAHYSDWKFMYVAATDLRQYYPVTAIYEGVSAGDLTKQAQEEDGEDEAESESAAELLNDRAARASNKGLPLPR